MTYLCRDVRVVCVCLLVLMLPHVVRGVASNSSNVTGIPALNTTTLPLTSTITFAPTTTAAPTPAPPTPVPPTPVPTGGAATPAPTDPPTTTTPAPTTTGAPPATTPAPTLPCVPTPFSCTRSPTRCATVLRADWKCGCVDQRGRVPEIVLTAPASPLHPVSDSLRADATAFFAWCPATDSAEPEWAAYDVRWYIRSIDTGEQVALEGATLSGPSLFVPRGSLSVDGSYLVEAEATVTGPIWDAVVRRNFTVIGVAPPVTVNILGGDRTLPTATSPLRIALNIDDAFEVSNSVSWTCCTVATRESRTCLELCGAPFDALRFFKTKTLALTPPAGAFPTTVVRLFASYKSATSSVGLHFVNDTAGTADSTLLLFVPERAAHRLWNRDVVVGSSWVAEQSAGLRARWSINGTDVRTGQGSVSADERQLAVAASAFPAGTTLEIRLDLTRGLDIVMGATAHLRLAAVPPQGQCTIRALETQPRPVESRLAMDIAGWSAATGAGQIERLVVVPMVVDSETGAMRPLVAAGASVDATGRATSYFNAPLVSDFVEMQRRDSDVTFAALMLDAATGSRLGMSRCTQRMYSFTFTSDLDELIHRLNASVSTAERGVTERIDAARALVVASRAIVNSTRGAILHSALRGLLDGLAITPASSLSLSALADVLLVVADTIRLLDSPAASAFGESVGTFGTAQTRVDQPSLLRRLTSALRRSFGAKAQQQQVSAVPLTNATAAALVEVVGKTADAGPSMLGGLAVSDSSVGRDVLATYANVLLRAPSAATRAKALSAIARFVIEAVAAAAPPVAPTAISASTVLSASVIRTTLGTPLLLSAALGEDAVVISTNRTVDATFAVDAAAAFVRASAICINMSAATITGEPLHASLWSQDAKLIIRGVRSRLLFLVPALAVINISTDSSASRPLMPHQSGFTLTFRTTTGALGRAIAASREDLTNHTWAEKVAASVECLEVRGDEGPDGLRAVPIGAAVAAEADVDAFLCPDPPANGAVTAALLRPVALDDALVTTTPSPPRPTVPPPQRYIGSDDNAMASITIALATVGAFVGVGLLAVGALLILRIVRKDRRDRPEEMPPGSEHGSFTERGKGAPPEGLLSVPVAAAGGAAVDTAAASPAAHRANPFGSMYMSMDGRDASDDGLSLSPVGRPPTMDRSRQLRTFDSGVFHDFSFTNAKVVAPPAIVLDEELSFVPHRKPLPKPEDDPTPWL